VRDGDPAALAGLCERRGPAVLAYCRHVAGDADAAAAAAEAFARFRAQVVAADDPASLNPEALLISATRHAAARHATVVATGLCAEVPGLLAGRADRSISPANVEFLTGHLEVCWTCRAPVARFEAAERAYRDPPDPTVPPEAAEAIVAALTAAAPVRTAGEEPPPEVIPLPAPTANGAGHRAAATAAPDEPAATDEPDSPTTVHRGLDDFAPRPRSTNGDRGPRRERREREHRGALAVVRGTLGAGVARAQQARGPGTGGREATRRAAPQPRLGSGTSLPRPARPSPVRPARQSPVRAGRRRERDTMRPSVVLPIVLVVGAFFVALLVAGVFGADDPASSPRSVAPPPAAAPATTTAPEVVVVPGADNASGSDVERAKARARAESQPQPAPDHAAATPATPPPPPPPPAASAAPPAAPAAEPPAAPSGGAKPKVKPKPKPKPAPRDKDSARIDTDNGATGVEPRLPKQKSKVPELAPPPEPATPTPQPPG
jgi:hypothetical protein